MDVGLPPRCACEVEGQGEHKRRCTYFHTFAVNFHPGYMRAADTV